MATKLPHVVPGTQWVKWKDCTHTLAKNCKNKLNKLVKK